MDPRIQEIFDRLGIKVDDASISMGKLSASTQQQIRSATAQALAQAKAHKDLLKSIEDQLKASGSRTRASKAELESIAKKIKQEEELFEKTEASAKKQKELDTKREVQLKQFLGTIGSLGSSALSASTSFYASDKAFTAVTGTLDLMGGALKSVIEATSLVASGIPVLGGVTSGMGKLAAAAVDVGVKVAMMQLEMTQAYTDSFDKLAATGMAFGGNINEMSKAAHLGGLDLRTYSQFVLRNIDSLNQLGGTLEQASNRVLKMSKAALDGNDKLLMLYGGFDGVNDALVEYNRQIAKTGYDTIANQAKISAGSGEYLTNLKMLSELTGKDVKTLQKEQEEAMNDMAFRIKMGEIRAKSEEKYNNIMQSVSIAMATGGKDMANQFKEKVALDGELMSLEQLRIRSFNEAGDAYTTALYKAVELEGKVRSDYIQTLVAQYDSDFKKQVAAQKDLTIGGQYFGTEFTKMLLETTRQQLDTAATRSGFEDAWKNAAGNINTILEDEAKRVAELKKKNMEGRVEVDKVIAANVAKMADVATQLTKLQTDLIKTFGPTLTDAVNEATAALLRLAGSVPGGKLAAPTVTGTNGKQVLAPQVPAPGSRESKLNKDWLGRPISSGPDSTKTTISDIDSLINFGNNSGDRKHFDGLNAGVKDRFLQMASEYYASTKQKLTVASSFRSYEEQKRLYDEWIKGGKQGNPVADPDSKNPSRHQIGNAIDIKPSEIKALKSLDLLSKYKFNEISGDDVHIESAMAKGGITQGPSLAGEAGPEAVVPLPDGRNIPVKMDTSELVAKMEELIRIAKDQRDNSEKMLHAVS